MTMFGGPPVPDWLQQQPQPMQSNIAPSMMQTGQVKHKRGGMFGSGLNAGEVIVNLLNGALAGAGNPVGIANIKMMQDAYREKQMRAQEEAQYQRQRSDSRDDFLWKQEHSQPEQPSYARDLMAAGIMPGTPKFNQLYGQYVQQKAQTGGSLFGNLFKDPATGQQYMPADLPPLGQEMDDPRKQGGPTPQASGGFPPFGY